MRFALALVLFVATSWGFAHAAEDEGAPVPERVEGGRATVIPPAGWGAAPSTENGIVAHQAPKQRAVVEARLLQVREGDEPRKVLMRAMDALGVRLGADAVAFPTIEAEGRNGSAARAEMIAMTERGKWAGFARLIRASPATWALAWGFAAPDAEQADRDALRAFVESLAPASPRLYLPEWAGRATPADEVSDALEKRTGVPMTLSARAEVLRVLSRRPTDARPLDPARFPEGEVDGVRKAVSTMLDEMRTPVLSLDPEDGPTSGDDGTVRLLRAHVQAWLEHAAFLTSIAANRHVHAPACDAEGLPAWDELPAQRRNEMVRVADAWTATRKQFRDASESERLAWRLRVLARLRPDAPQDPPPDVLTLADWFEAHPPDVDALLTAAATP